MELNKYIPKLKRFFRDEASMIPLVMTQWIITLFTMDFSIELSFCIIDMFLVFGWRAVYGTILNILMYMKHPLSMSSEEDSIQLVKKFIKEGNIDLDHFFQDVHKFRISERELKILGRKFYKAYLPSKIVSTLSNRQEGGEMFSTFDTPSSKIEIHLHNNPEPKHISTVEDEPVNPKTTLKYKRRERNRIPRKFDSKRSQIRLSSANHYKPLENIRSPMPIQMSSDEEDDVKSVEHLPQTEEGKFLIPNEGNVNKSPMFLLKKDNKVNQIFKYRLMHLLIAQEIFERNRLV